MSKHTKGPWYGHSIGLPRVESDGRYVFDVTRSDSERLANANLIAAAPALLEALEELVEAILIIAPEASCKPALAAIAKAKGEQQ
tara:strand:+ start:22089 stop:22343 length:255 start_codon:yes stop_codon:yes gene_type:complete